MPYNVSEKMGEEAVCMGYSERRGKWSGDMCKTNVSLTQPTVTCHCTSIDNKMQGVFLVQREVTSEVSPVVMENLYPFIAITVTLGLIGILLPLIGQHLDKSDYKKEVMLREQFNS